jgi:hypothetical protein
VAILAFQLGQNSQFPKDLFPRREKQIACFYNPRWTFFQVNVIAAAHFCSPLA